jgi:hypothetical protein
MREKWYRNCIFFNFYSLELVYILIQVKRYYPVLFIYYLRNINSVFLLSSYQHIVVFRKQYYGMSKTNDILTQS